LQQCGRIELRRAEPDVRIHLRQLLAKKRVS
jgi:hypothetical protein